MFKKFKEKIAEEVKSSPQRLQQFTQSVADKIQQNSSSEENSYFSIAEDDNLQNNVAHSEPGFSNVPLTNYSGTPRNDNRIRRSSTSSMASDISFLPRYESNTNIYHLQSDLDVSASELEDNASSSSSQLGHLTKEQLYAAFKKSQMRYHKYRGRFTDLANHYKTLERENSKMKSVLGETQDNALRRVAELKEQCSLEQKAKAHLENALRVEMDEKQYTIETLHTKIGLLRNGPLPADETAANNLDLLANDLRDARTEIETLNAKLQETKANSIVLSSREGDLKKKVAELEAAVRGKDEELGKVVERERETNLQEAQTKMELHCEIQNRDLELANLKRDMETMRVDLDQYENGKKSVNLTKLDNLQEQNVKLVEKVEALHEKLIAYESDKLQLEKLKIEVEDYRKRLTETSDLKSQLNQQETEYSEKIKHMKEEAKHNLLSLGTKIRDQVSAEFARRELELKEKLSSSEGGAEDVQLKLIESETEVENLRELVSELQGEKDRSKEMESHYLLLMEEKDSIKNEARNLEEELSLVKIKIDELQKEVAEAETTQQIDTLLTETSDLKSQLNKQETEHSEKIKRMKEEAKHHLLSLGTKIRDEVSAEFARRELELREKLSNSEGGAEDIQLKLVASETEVRELVSELQEEKDRSKEMESDYLLLLEEKENEARNLEGELSLVKNKIDELQKEVADVETGKRLDQQEIHSLVQMVEQHNVNAANKQEQVSRLNSDLSSLAHRLQEIESQKQESEQHSESLEQQLTQSFEENSRLSRLTEKYKTELEEYKKQLVRAKQERDNLSKLSDAQADSCETLIDRLEEAERKLFESKEERERLTQNYEAVVAQLEEGKIELTQVRQERDELSDANESVTARFENTVIKLRENEGLVQKYEARLEEEKKQASQLKQEREKLSEANKTLNAQLEQAESKWQKLQKETDSFKAAIERFERDESEWSNANETMTRRFAEAEEAIRALQSDHREEIGRLQADLDKHRKRIEEANEEIENLREKDETHATKLNGYDVQVEDFKKAVKELSDENRRLKQALEVKQTETEQRIEDLKKAHSEELKRACDDFELQVPAAENELLEKKHAEEFEFRCTSLEKENFVLTESVKGLTEQLATVQAALETLQKERDEKEEVRMQLEAEKRALVERLDRLQENQSETKKLASEVEVEELRHKLAQYKSLDQSNRSSIQFYEGELQKLKNRNEKLGRRLDETLVALNHCPDLTHSTENEYLRNVLYNYMLGKESIVLARVIAAVCKFDATQTEAVIQREQQKQTLLGQLGFI